MTREIFIKKFNEVYASKYECKIPEGVTEIKPGDNVQVMCQKHGLFWETAYDLLNDAGCFKCFTENK